jgi:hypothetical protein
MGDQENWTSQSIENDSSWMAATKQRPIWSKATMPQYCYQLRASRACLILSEALTNGVRLQQGVTMDQQRERYGTRLRESRHAETTTHA